MSIPIEALSEPFPSDQIKQRKGNFGNTLDYVDTATVINRLNQDLKGGGEHIEILLSYKNLNVISESDNFKAKTGKAKIYTNYPNPFNSSKLIHFNIPRSNSSKLQIFDIYGQIGFNQYIQCLGNCSQFFIWGGC